MSIARTDFKIEFTWKNLKLILKKQMEIIMVKVKIVYIPKQELF